MRIQGDTAKFRENKIYKENITLNIEEERYKKREIYEYKGNKI